MKTIDFTEAINLLKGSEFNHHFTLDAPEHVDGHALVKLVCVSEDEQIDGMQVLLTRLGNPRFKLDSLQSYPAYRKLKPEQSEGWGMFNCDDTWQLQRMDETGKFESDGKAILFVAAQAAAGSEGHMQALEMIGKEVNS